MLRRSLFALACFAVVAAACGGASPSPFGDDAVALWANRDLAVGTERLLVAVVKVDGTPLGDPSIEVTMDVAPEDDRSALQTKAAGFTWSVPGVVGFYRAEFDFDRPGIWELTLRADEGDPLETVLIQVRDNACRLPSAESPCAPRISELAPSLATPTLADSSLAELTTDPTPDPRLYGLSLDELLGNGRPGVIVFVTPAYCQTASCGPVVANIKTIIGDYPGVDFAHIEVYTGLLDDDFVPDGPHLAPAMLAWTLPTEPWVFVVDGAGVITARFEGALDPEELRPHL